MAERSERESILEELGAARERTFDLYRWVGDGADLRRRVDPSFRPLLWHLAHLGAFEEWWLLIQEAGEAPLRPRYMILFDPIRTPREQADELPAREEIDDYLARVRARVCDLYLAGEREAGPRDSILQLVLEHELQHQETVSYLLQMLPPERKRRPHDAIDQTTIEAASGGMIDLPGGRFTLGADGRRFVYDNEMPPHEVEVSDFRLDRRPVTEGEYAEFIRAGGYRERALWTNQGWEWKEREVVAHPLYWAELEDSDGWGVQGMFEWRALDARLPVTGVSWHEAMAYARWAGRRLPTEVEWERAASWDAKAGEKRLYPWGDAAPTLERCNFDSGYLGVTPAGALAEGASADGVLDLAGNVWEWTASTFDGYPGFRADPYPEYSELWFDGDHRVLRGGSWMTRARLLRATFRNFFRPGFRQAFAGFRCAA